MPHIEHLDVLIVGAGLSGIGAACRLRADHPLRSFAILEARDAIGGTWDLFRYPGVRSDSDMYTLGYPFAPWTGKAIGDGPSIRAYTDHIRYGHRVISAEWSSERARWTVTALRDEQPDSVTLTCSVLYACCGYYRYDQGYAPDFRDAGAFSGTMVHPQHWPENLDFEGKRVVVIGSGATAITMVPALAERAAKVTMLQRSPSYVISLPSRDVLAERLVARLPSGRGYRAARWKNMRIALGIYQLSRKAPRLMRGLITRGVARQLPDGYDVSMHFTPHYDPWDQRMCLSMDGDLFAAIRSGRAEVVNLLPIGGMRLVIDGSPVELNQTFAYKAMMLSGVPNFVFAVGYTNASWTLKADLVAQHVSRLLAYCDDHGFGVFMPTAPGSLARHPLIGLTSGYVRRSVAQFPSQGAVAPWRVHQHYPRDVRLLARRPVADQAMTFGCAADPVAGDNAGLRRLMVNGRVVRCRDTGAGPPVLLIHGVGRSLEDWDAQHDLLSAQCSPERARRPSRRAAARYRVISVDLPGFGGSQRLAEPNTLAGLARFAADTLDALGVSEPVRVAGNSLGGAVAMRLAVDSPERVASLLLVNSAGFGREVTPGLRILSARPNTLARAVLRPSRTGARFAERSVFHDAAFATPARIERGLRFAGRPDGADVMLETLRPLGGLRGQYPGWRAELLTAVSALDLPILLVWGECDVILPASHLDAARAALPAARTHLFPGAGHMPQVERALDFAKLALDFWS